jgi:hypothetical protein
MREHGWIGEAAGRSNQIPKALWKNFRLNAQFLRELMP